MKVKCYEPTLFYERYQDELLQKEAVYQLLITNCQNAMEDSQIECLIGTVEDEEKTYLFFQYTRPYRMLIYALGEVNEIMIGTLTNYLKKEKINITGINTSKKIADLFLRIEEIKNYKIRAKMDVMELKNGELIEQIPIGKLVCATIEQLSFGQTCYQNFYRECFNEEGDVEAGRVEIKALIEKKNLFFYEVSGTLVAMCAINRKLIRGVSVSLVYTLPQYRGNGYAKQMMSELAKVIFANKNEFACLYVDQCNPSSNKAYKAIGYKIMEDQRDIVFIF